MSIRRKRIDLDVRHPPTPPLLGWGMIVAVHGVYAFVMKTPEESMIERAAREEQRARAGCLLRTF
jgi:hypothetical protein